MSHLHSICCCSQPAWSCQDQDHCQHHRCCNSFGALQHCLSRFGCRHAVILLGSAVGLLLCCPGPQSADTGSLRSRNCTCTMLLIGSATGGSMHGLHTTPAGQDGALTKRGHEVKHDVGFTVAVLTKFEMPVNCHLAWVLEHSGQGRCGQECSYC